MELELASAACRNEVDAPCGVDDPRRSDESARAAARVRLREEFGIDSLFLKVSDLAKITGLAATSIHAQVREERCPLPHRRVGQVILFRVEDFLDWYCGAPARVRISTDANGNFNADVKAETKPASLGSKIQAAEKSVDEDRGREAARHPRPARGEKDDAAGADLVPPAFGASKAEVAKYKKLLLDLVARDEATGRHGEKPRARAERVDQETRTQMDLARRGRRGNR